MKLERSQQEATMIVVFGFPASARQDPCWTPKTQLLFLLSPLSKIEITVTNIRCLECLCKCGLLLPCEILQLNRMADRRRITNYEHSSASFYEKGTKKFGHIVHDNYPMALEIAGLA